MSKSKEQPSGRERLETGVQRIGRAFDELVKNVERSGDLSATDLAKAFNFLGDVALNARRKAELSLSTAKAANGGFSLDQDYEPPITTPTLVASDARAPRKERMVGDRNKPTVAPEDEDDVDFIEE